MAAADRRSLLPVDEPLLDLAEVPDAGGREPLARLGHPFPQAGVRVEDAGRLPVGVEEVAQQLHVHGGSGADADGLALVLVVGDLGRLRGVGDQPAVLGLLGEGVEEELHRALEDRVVGAQRRLVAGEPVALPQHQGQPRAAGGPHAVLGEVHGAVPRQASVLWWVTQPPAP